MILIAGGQTGVDQGAMLAARDAGVPCEGWVPRGWLVETADGKGWEGAPWLADFGLREHRSDKFPDRTSDNVAMADVVAWFGPTGSTGYWCTVHAAERHGKPVWHVGSDPTAIRLPSDLLVFVRRDGVTRLMAAGNRESKCPGIGERTREFMGRFFRAVQKEGQRDAVSAGADNGRFVDRPVGAHGGRR